MSWSYVTKQKRINNKQLPYYGIKGAVHYRLINLHAASSKQSGKLDPCLIKVSKRRVTPDAFQWASAASALGASNSINYTNR